MSIHISSPTDGGWCGSPHCLNIDPLCSLNIKKQHFLMTSFSFTHGVWYDYVLRYIEALPSLRFHSACHPKWHHVMQQWASEWFCSFEWQCISSCHETSFVEGVLHHKHATPHRDEMPYLDSEMRVREALKHVDDSTWTIYRNGYSWNVCCGVLSIEIDNLSITSITGNTGPWSWFKIHSRLVVSTSILPFVLFWL